MAYKQTNLENRLYSTIVPVEFMLVPVEFMLV